MQGPSQEPGQWVGTVTDTKEGVLGLNSKDHWDKFKNLIHILVDMEDREEAGLDISKMELIRGFLVYMARTYWDINPYLKVLHLTLDSWKPFRDNEEWIIQM